MAEIYNHVDISLMATDAESVEAIREIIRDISMVYCEGDIDISNEPGYDATTMPSYVSSNRGLVPQSHSTTLWKMWCAFEAILPYFIADDDRKISQYANSEHPGQTLTYLRWKSSLNAFCKNIGRGTKCNEQLRKAGLCLFKKINHMKQYNLRYPNTPLALVNVVVIAKLERIINLIDLSMWMRRHLFNDQLETSTDSLNGNKFVDFRNGVLTIEATY